jgi:hypothetical protein
MSQRFRAHLRSNVVGYLAMFLALTGTAVALPGRNRIDRNDLQRRVVGPINVQRNAIRGFQLAPSSVGGFHVKENTLGKVPSAASADNAEAVDGVSAFEVDLSMADDGPAQQFDVGPFKIDLSCAAGSISLIANSDIPSAIGFFGSAWVHKFAPGGLANTDQSDTFKLGGDPNVVLVNAPDHGGGTLIVRSSSAFVPGATNYTLDYRYQDAAGCSVNGIGLIS